MPEFFEYAPKGMLPVIIGGIALAVAARVFAGILDVWRIQNYISSAGGQVIRCRWWPFGPGWLGEKRDRIYHVAFTDHEGAEHRAYCKTSLLTGVYFTQDRVRYPGKTSLTDFTQQALKSELELLRQENQQLRQQLARKESG